MCMRAFFDARTCPYSLYIYLYGFIYRIYGFLFVHVDCKTHSGPSTLYAQSNTTIKALGLHWMENTNREGEEERERESERECKGSKKFYTRKTILTYTRKKKFKYKCLI